CAAPPGCIRQAIRRRRGLERALEPVRAARAVGAVLERGAGQRKPLAVDLHRAGRVDADFAVALVRLGLAYADHALQPAVRAADRVGVHTVGEVLMDADVVPPDAAGVRIEGAPGGAAALELEVMLVAFLG